MLARLLWESFNQLKVETENVFRNEIGAHFRLMTHCSQIGPMIDAEQADNSMTIHAAHGRLFFRLIALFGLRGKLFVSYLGSQSVLTSHGAYRLPKRHFWRKSDCPLAPTQWDFGERDIFSLILANRKHLGGKLVLNNDWLGLRQTNCFRAIISSFNSKVSGRSAFPCSTQEFWRKTINYFHSIKWFALVTDPSTS